MRRLRTSLIVRYYLSVIVLIGTSCATAPEIKTTQYVDLPRPWVDPKETCATFVDGGNGVAIKCPKTVFIQSMIDSVRLWGIARDLHHDRVGDQILASIDCEQTTARLTQSEIDRDHMSQMRWVWGAVALVAGVAVGGGLVLAAQ